MHVILSNNFETNLFNRYNHCESVDLEVMIMKTYFTLVKPSDAVSRHIRTLPFLRECALPTPGDTLILKHISMYSFIDDCVTFKIHGSNTTKKTSQNFMKIIQCYLNLTIKINTLINLRFHHSIQICVALNRHLFVKLRVLYKTEIFLDVSCTKRLSQGWANCDPQAVCGPQHCSVRPTGSSKNIKKCKE